MEDMYKTTARDAVDGDHKEMSVSLTADYSESLVRFTSS